MTNTDTYPTQSLNQITPLWLVFIVSTIIASLLVALYLMTVTKDPKIIGLQTQSTAYGLAWGILFTSLTRTGRLMNRPSRP